jgi:hypothetical protein
MYVLLFVLLFVFTTSLAAQSGNRESHFSEAGSGAVFVRSAFAHGYRHGYEEGYRAGNIDINMGRPIKNKLNQIHDVRSGYAADFGPRKSFDAGFDEGLKAGYNDGYAGVAFRAVENLRFVASALAKTPISSDPKNQYFDLGFSSGYRHGVDRVQADGASIQKLDFRSINCNGSQPGRQQDSSVQESFCDGYRRGYALGHADGVVLDPERGSLAARK